MVFNFWLTGSVKNFLLNNITPKNQESNTIQRFGTVVNILQIILEHKIYENQNTLKIIEQFFILVAYIYLFIYCDFNTGTIA